MKSGTRAAHLHGLERYEPGLSIEEVQARSGLRHVVKLASNENPLGPSPLALEALRSTTASLHRYPDGPARVLRAALARRHDVDPGQVVIGNGSTDLIDLLARAFLGPEHDAVVSAGAFARFQQVVRARNGRVRVVPMSDLRQDLAAMRAAVGERTRLVYLANPNNPTGTWSRRAELEAFLADLPPDVLLVLDEAYYEYADDPDYPHGVDHVRAGAPVVVLRTFSKAYGLAGLRIGYGIAAAPVVEAVDTIREPFNVNALGQVAALAALDDHDHVARAVELNRTEMARLRSALAALGLDVRPSLGNFLFVETGRDGAEVFRRLLARGVIVRPLHGYGFAGAVRVSVGTAEDNGVFLAALEVVLRELPR